MNIYSSSVVLLYQGPRVTVAAVFCGGDCEELAVKYIVDHPVPDGVYEVQDVEAEVRSRVPSWGVTGERG